MRLPYAALRMLPPDNRSAGGWKTWCYAEIAHRVYRHTGRSSLLDQYRAVRRFRAGRQQGIWSVDELLRIAGSLEGLGLYSLSARFASDALSAGLSEQQRLRAEAILQRVSDRSDRSPGNEADFGTAENRIRRALTNGARGARIDVNLREAKMPAVVGAYYRTLLSAADRTPDGLSEALIDVLKSPEFPKRLHGEAWFYLGCLAIELGDSEGALQVLARSAEAAPGSPFLPLRRMYRQNLSRNARR